MIIDLLLGRHGYSITPEEETDFARLCLLMGCIAGFIAGSSSVLMLARAVSP